MRKLLIVGLVLLLAVPVFAADATMKGSWSLGNSVTTDGFGSSIGYFYMDNLEIGAGFEFYSKTSDNGTNEATDSRLGFSLGGAYYLSQMGPGYPYAKAGLKWSSQTENTGASGADDEVTSRMDINLGVGYLWFLQDNVAWYGDLSYGIGSRSVDDGTTTTDYDLSGITFGIGLKVFIF